MMLLVFLAVLVVLLVVKLVRVSRIWHGKGLVYEPYYHYLYRILWILNTGGMNEFHAAAAKRYGRTFGTYKGFTPVLATTEVGIAKDVLIKQFDNFFKRTIEFTTGEPVWDHNLMNLPYDQWKSMRSAMGYAFTTSKMRHMITKFDVMAKRLTKKLNALAKAKGGYIDTKFHDYAKMYAIDSTLAIAYGKDTNCIENPDSQLMKYVTGFVEPGLGNFLFFVAPKLFKYVPGVSFPPKKTTDFFKGLAKQMFKEKRAKLDEAVASGTTDIIDRQLLMQRENPDLTDELLTSQAFLFMVAGLDPTAAAMSITVYHLALFPDAQQKAFEELKSVLGDRREVRHDDVQELRYLEGCILESFRFFPFLTQVDRICSSDTEVGGIPIEKGTVVEFLTYEMMQNPEYFPEPTKFRPERFVKTEYAQQQELGAFLLFGDGPKHCAGKRLALMNSLVILANMVMDFKFETCPETPTLPLKMRPGFEFSKMTQRPLVIRFRSRS